jgi:UDP:flavonoid glycosyltransferase YjiC (YdhE family)
MSMRILFTTFAERPHYFPMVPFAWACRAAGHDVRMASTPGLQSVIAESGLPAVSVGHDIDLEGMLKRGEFAPKSAPDPAKAWVHVLENLANMQFAMCEAMVDDLIDFGRAWRPDVVVHDPVTFAGPVTAQVLDVPSVAFLFGSPGLLRVEMKELGDEPWPAYLALFERFGVDARLDPTMWIDPCPPTMRLPEEVAIRPAPKSVDRRPVRFVPYNGPAAVQPWQRSASGRPRVCVTWGTTASRMLGQSVLDLVQRVLKALGELDVELVLAFTPQLRDMLGDLPANTLVAEPFALHLALPGCAAIVHQGGAGTTLTSAACGVPQLGITEIPEPKISAQQMAATGAGQHLFPADADVATIRDTVAALVGEEQYRAAARRLQADIAAQPSPVALVGAVEDLVTAAPAPPAVTVST